MENKYIHNNKEYNLNEVYNSFDYWKFIKIQFNEWDRIKLYKKEGWEAIKFNLNEVYNSSDYWEFIKIQFNEWDLF